MLAATDVPATSLAVDAVVSAAVHTGGVSVAADLTALDKFLDLNGPGYGDITVDLGQLPASVVKLQISSFSTVTLVGEHSLNYLMVNDVSRLDAGHVEISLGLYTHNVDRVQIDTAPSFAWLEGNKTLMEVDHFPQTPVTWISNLNQLGLSTKTLPEELKIVSLFNPGESILLNFQPEPGNLNFAGINSLSQVSEVKGDFVRYFLASPSELSTLEQSLVAVRQSVTANLVSISSLLNNSGVQTALSEILAANLTFTKANPQVLSEAEFSSLRMSLHPSPAHDLTPAAPAATEPAAPSRAILQPLFEIQVGPSENQPASASARTPAEPGLGPVGLLGLAVGEVEAAARYANNRFGDQVSDAVHNAMSRMSAPLMQVVSDLRDKLSTFGEIASVRVTDQLKVDHQSPLLVDARSSRQGNDQEVSVILV